MDSINAILLKLQTETRRPQSLVPRLQIHMQTLFIEIRARVQCTYEHVGIQMWNYPLGKPRVHVRLTDRAAFAS